MCNSQFPFPCITDESTEKIKSTIRYGRSLGFLEAMDIVGLLSATNGHSIETETLNWIYEALESGYSERFASQMNQPGNDTKIIQLKTTLHSPFLNENNRSIKSFLGFATHIRHLLKQLDPLSPKSED